MVTIKQAVKLCELSDSDSVLLIPDSYGTKPACSHSGSYLRVKEIRNKFDMKKIKVKAIRLDQDFYGHVWGYKFIVTGLNF